VSDGRLLRNVSLRKELELRQIVRGLKISCIPQNVGRATHLQKCCTLFELEAERPFMVYAEELLSKQNVGSPTALSVRGRPPFHVFNNQNGVPKISTIVPNRT
jgi:hypothetical protein